MAKKMPTTAAKLPQSTKNAGTHELLYQALETELGGVELYRAALTAVENRELREEWTKYLGQTEVHVQTMVKLLTKLGLDPERDTPGRQVVRHIGKALVTAIQMAKGASNSAAAELVACECVVLAETKDHLNWTLLGELAKAGRAAGAGAIQAAYDAVEDEEDEHVYHSTGWCRELWMQALDLEAILPPPEEREDVKSASEAAAVRETRSTD